MQSITFEIPGQPQGKERHRDAKTRDGKRVRYTPTKTKKYEHYIRMCFLRKSPRFVCIEEEVDVSIVAFFRIPTSTSKKMRAAMLRNEICPKVKPDRDNIDKAICDALNGIAYKDDAHTVDGPVRKRYSERPRVVVRITWGTDIVWHVPEWAL